MIQILSLSLCRAKRGTDYWHGFFLQLTPWVRIGLWYWAPGIKKHFYITTKPFHYNLMAFPLAVTVKLK